MARLAASAERKEENINVKVTQKELGFRVLGLHRRRYLHCPLLEGEIVFLKTRLGVEQLLRS